MKFKQIVALDDVNISEDAVRQISMISESEFIRFNSDSTTSAESVKRIGDADCVLVSWRSPIDREVLTKCPNLRFICLCGTNSDSIDLDEAKKQDIVVSNIMDYGDEGVGEWVFSQLLILARGLGKYQWKSSHAELANKTMGIIGLGAIGKLVADIALGFHMNVLYNSKTRKPEYEAKGLKYVGKKELLTNSDFITLQTPKNLKILTKEDFSFMNGKVLVNNTLGKPFEIEDIKEWIKGENNFVIMDTCVSQDYHKELSNTKRVIFSDFIAGRTEESVVRLGDKTIKNLKAFLTNKPINQVN